MTSSFADAERACFWDLFENSPTNLTEVLGLGARALGETLAFRAGALSHLALNRAVGLHHEKDLSEKHIDECLGFFRESKENRFMIQLPIGAEFDRVRSFLRERSLVPYRRRWVQYERDGSPPRLPSVDFEVRDAIAEDGVRIGQILCAAFDCRSEGAPLFASIIGRDNWCTKVACTPEGTIMGVGMMYLTDASAYLAFGATDPAYRRRGIQGALMAARLSEAAARGCRHIATETGEAIPGEPNPSGNNMLRYGFRPSLCCDNWTLPGTTWLPP